MGVSVSIPVGASASRTVVVTRELTVAHFHPEMPEVYGTPMMIYLMELAASDAIQKFLPQGWASVGAVVNVKHLAATPVGFTVTASAKVVEVGDRMISFTVEAHDGTEKIGEGTHVRGLIDLQRFHGKMSQKTRPE
jgi:predicted thioesterase